MAVVMQPACPSPVVDAAAMPAQLWRGELALQFSQQPHAGAALRTALTHVKHAGPLRMQKVLYPEGDAICHGVILHPPGGVAGGDALHMQVQVQPQAHAVLTTPGATRWYKSLARPSQQHVQLSVADGAILEWLPQENLLFAGAQAHLHLHLDLAPTAHVLGWDASVLGRYASGEAWHSAEKDQGLPSYVALDNRIACGEHLLWVEQGKVQSDDALLHSICGWHHYPVQASFWAASPRCNTELVERLAQVLPWQDSVRAGVSLLAAAPEQALPAVALVRILAHTMEPVRRLLINLRSIARPYVLGVDDVPLRLWAT